MSGKRDKAIRKAMDKRLAQHLDIILIDLCKKGLIFRLKVAWRVVLKKYKANPEAKKVHAKIKRNTLAPLN